MNSSIAVLDMFTLLNNVLSATIRITFFKNLLGKHFRFCFQQSFNLPRQRAIEERLLPSDLNEFIVTNVIFRPFLLLMLFIFSCIGRFFFSGTSSVTPILNYDFGSSNSKIRTFPEDPAALRFESACLVWFNFISFVREHEQFVVIKRIVIVEKNVSDDLFSVRRNKNATLCRNGLLSTMPFFPSFVAILWSNKS